MKCLRDSRIRSLVEHKFTAIELLADVSYQTRPLHVDVRMVRNDMTEAAQT